MSALALVAIDGYQRFLSPYKGFCCAYRFHTGHKSCSELGYRAIRMYGVLSGWAILRRRFERCGVAHRRYGSRATSQSQQRGICDLPCVDIPGVHCCDAAACAPSPCDCANLWNSKRTPSNAHVYVPPQKEDSHDSNVEPGRREL